MGSSSDSVQRLFDLRNLPEDQYVCTECNSVPEIIGIDYMEGIIEFKCQKHGINKVDIKEYFLKESNYLYCNYKCYSDPNHIQIDKLPNIFNHFINAGKNLCTDCSTGKKSKSIKVNKLTSICLTHLKQYNKYCKECNKHFCSEDINNCNHEVLEIENPNNKEIDMIKNKRNILMKQKELNGYLIKILNTLLTTYEQHPSNYYNSNNIKNVVKDILNKLVMNYKISKNDQIFYISEEKKDFENKLL